MPACPAREVDLSKTLGFWVGNDRVSDTRTLKFMTLVSFLKVWRHMRFVTKFGCHLSIWGGEGERET